MRRRPSPASSSVAPSAATPLEFVQAKRRAKITCGLCSRVQAKLGAVAAAAVITLADTQHIEHAIGGVDMADWLKTLHDIALDHNQWARHWRLQDEGKHP